MRYFDLCARSAGQEVENRAKKLGFSGIGVILRDFIPKDRIAGVELKSVKGVDKLRKRAEIIAVRTEDPDTARKAMENPRVDVVFCKEANHVMVKIAKRNGVAIGFDFSEVLHSFGRKRSDVLSQYRKLAALVSKYGASFVLTSGARSMWDLRSPSDLEAFGKVLGLENPKSGLTDRIVKENRKRLGGRWIMPGVENV